MTNSLPSRDLLLIGAGHTNLHVVRMWKMRPIPDVRLTLVSAFSRATYSGMLPGTLAGLYGPDDMEIDLRRFTECCGVRLVVDEAIAFDPEIRRVLFADRPPLRYDVASIGIGSIPGQRELWAGNPRILSIKPMATFAARFEQRVRSLPQGEKVRVAIIGAGAGGTEVAFGLEAWLRSRSIDAQMSLCDSNSEILSGYTLGTITRARRELAGRGITVMTGRRVKNITGKAGADVVFDDGTMLPGDIIIWATAAAPPLVLANIRLPKAEDGFLAVAATLKTIADFPVFAVGDSATIAGEQIPKAGVYAVREGPILWENLNRVFANQELVRYEPQRGFLSLLSTGDGQAIAEYKGLSGHGRWAWKWKDHIDRKFMKMYQDYTPRADMPQRAVPRRAGRGHRFDENGSPRISVDARIDSPQNDPANPPMRCFGCGSKIGANILSAALERLHLPPDGRTKLGLESPDDATVLDRHAAPVDVLSVDFFPAFMDDPYLVGRVAVLNSLSDLWAMGSEPLGAMAIVTLPEGSPTQQTELLYQLLAGGVRELTAAGATLWGGHTTEGPELTVGYTVAGKLDGRPPFTKGNLKPGDRLILTKPIGTATLLAAQRQSLCRARWFEAMIDSMVRSNAAAAQLARTFNVGAVTDVTGFGLAGHLLEMLDASHVSARLSLGALPLLAGFADLNAKGIRSSLDAANRASEGRCRLARPELATRPEYHALFDPQTSGGLLVAVPVDRAAEFMNKLRANGIPAAVEIGEVLGASESVQLELVD
jgi:selenide,water dikinase